MTHSHSAIVLKTSIAVALCLATVARAEEPSPTKLTLHPKAAPTPALKYRLLPEVVDLISGNAAVEYGKVTAEEMNFFKNVAHTDTIDEWQTMPLEKLRSAKISLPEGSIFFLERGARCKNCDWQLAFGQVPFYTIRLPEAQQSRSYARLLAVKARLEIASGKFDDAVKTFQMNNALARHLAKGETLVNGLIGIAICGIMVPQITEFVQQSDAPNLYWALSTLPSPTINMQDAIDLESRAIELSFPEFRDVETARRTPEEWRGVFHNFAKLVTEWTQTGNPPSPKAKSPEELDKLCEQLFPIAKRELIDEGMAAEKVDAMPTYQIAMLHTSRAYHKSFDDAAKYYMLPYPEATAGLSAAAERAEKGGLYFGEVVPVARSAMGALQATRTAVVRNDRNFAVLRVIEALRLHAAENEGKLPEKLADISIAAIPDDPVTGKPFVYRLERGKAILVGPTLPNAPLNYEITMLSGK